MMNWGSWKTTIAGLMSIGLGLYHMTSGDSVSGVGLVTTGLGLVVARDNNVTSKQAGAE